MVEKFDPNRSMTLRGFRYVENMSAAKYYDLKNKGLGPEELNVDGMIRITPEARAKWRERMAELARSEAAQLEAERRRELAVIAGCAAAQSPLHVSKQKRQNRRPAATLADSANPATSKRAEQSSRRAPAGAGTSPNCR
jgi:hypothetical protein